MRSQGDVGDRFPHAALEEHPVESPAGANHQENGGGRREAVARELEELIPCEVLPVSQRPEGEEQRQEQCARARESVAQYEMGGRFSGMNEKGERYFMDENQIAQAKARAQALVTESCK